MFKFPRHTVLTISHIRPDDGLNPPPLTAPLHLYIDLQQPLPKTNFLKRSFSYRGAMAWNQLSNETREMGDLTSFKLAIS